MCSICPWWVRGLQNPVNRPSERWRGDRRTRGCSTVVVRTTTIGTVLCVLQTGRKKPSFRSPPPTFLLGPLWPLPCPALKKGLKKKNKIRRDSIFTYGDLPNAHTCTYILRLCDTRLVYRDTRVRAVSCIDLASRISYRQKKPKKERKKKKKKIVMAILKKDCKTQYFHLPPSTTVRTLPVRPMYPTRQTMYYLHKIVVTLEVTLTQEQLS